MKNLKRSVAPFLSWKSHLNKTTNTGWKKIYQGNYNNQFEIASLFGLCWTMFLMLSTMMMPQMMFTLVSMTTMLPLLVISVTWSCDRLFSRSAPTIKKAKSSLIKTTSSSAALLFLQLYHVKEFNRHCSYLHTFIANYVNK